MELAVVWLATAAFWGGIVGLGYLHRGKPSHDFECLTHPREHGCPPPAPQTIASIAGSLSSCSPFETLDGRRMLIFTWDSLSWDEPSTYRVVADETSTSEDGKDVLFAARPRETKGLWSIEDTKANRISVVIGRAKTEYVLLTWSDGLKCALVSGSISNADLTQSFFGEQEPEDEAR